MAIFQDLFSYLFVLNLLLAGTVIFLERKNVAATWAWLMILYFIPAVGFILYLILGQNLKRRKIYKIKTDRMESIQKIVRNQFEQLEEGRIAYNDPSIEHYDDMIYMNLGTAYAVFTQDNQVEVFTDGKKKFDSLLTDISHAKNHIHLVYFIVRNDELGRRLVKALAEKAKEGVEVRFLYDDIGTSLPKKFFRELLDAGGQVAAFFPSRVPYLNTRINFRNHRKLVIIDGTYGYIGGFNIGNEYLGIDERFGYWRDTHLKLQGGAVLQIQAQFSLDWNLAAADNLPFIARYFPMPTSIGKVGIQIVSSGPDSEEQQIRNAYIKMIHAAKKSIYLQTPYFIPDESLFTALKLAAQSGVDVRIMFPSKPDHKLVYWASSSYLGELLEVGVKCFLYEKGFLHAKTIAVDGKVASVGTTNIDIRSFKLNFEVNAFIYDTVTASGLEHIFILDQQYCSELTLEIYKQRSTFMKIKESLARLLSPIL
ncbi:Major cardiolipin synthase ClsA [compost metagenome]